MSALLYIALGVVLSQGYCYFQRRAQKLILGEMILMGLKQPLGAPKHNEPHHGSTCPACREQTGYV